LALDYSFNPRWNSRTKAKKNTSKRESSFACRTLFSPLFTRGFPNTADLEVSEYLKTRGINLLRARPMGLSNNCVRDLVQLGYDDCIGSIVALMLSMATGKPIPLHRLDLLLSLLLLSSFPFARYHSQSVLPISCTVVLPRIHSSRLIP
jgi:hypothetical protein